MSEFAGDYWHPLDKETAIKYHLDPRTVGIATPPMKSQLEELKTRVFQGASHVELGFMGKGKGSMAQGGTTPEMFGKVEREGMRELAKINDISLSTHASTQVQGMAGMGREGFDDQERENNLFEIKRTIDFAADIGGGPVVVHTGEFPTSIAEHKGFEGYPQEEDKATVYSIDKETGRTLALRKDIKIPMLKKDKDGNPIVDKYGKYEFMEKPVDYNYYKENEDKVKQDLVKKGYIDKKTANEIGPAQLFYMDYRSREIEQNEAEQNRFTESAEMVRSKRDKLNDIKRDFENLAETDPRRAKRFLMAQLIEAGAAPPMGSDRYRDFFNDPENFLKIAQERTRQDLNYYENGILSYGRNAGMVKEELKNVRPIEQVGVERSAETIARAAMNAYEISKKKKLEKPVFIAPENMFPEHGFGSHPDELRKVVVESRKAMEKELLRKNYSKKEAADIAKKHIKATFDIGHANTWKKFFKAKSDESPEKAEKRFNKWLVGEVDKLAKDGIIGHVHITDNFGYYDEHVTPGEGSAPIKEFVKKLKEAGYKGKMIIEPAHQDYQAMTGAWRTLNSPIYRIDGSTASWTDISGSYFGRTSSPGYLVGEYAPDPKEWTFWSETKLE